MALVECPECRGNVSTAASACPHCGHPLSPAQPEPHAWHPSNAPHPQQAPWPAGPPQAPAPPSKPDATRQGHAVLYHRDRRRHLGLHPYPRGVRGGRRRTQARGARGGDGRLSGERGAVLHGNRLTVCRRRILRAHEERLQLSALSAARTLAGVQISSCTAATEAWCFTLMGPDGDTLARCQATPGSCNDARVKAAPVHNNVSDHCSSVASVRYAMPRQSSSTADAYPR